MNNTGYSLDLVMVMDLKDEQLKSEYERCAHNLYVGGNSYLERLGELETEMKRRFPNDSA